MAKKILIISDSFCLESGGIENTSYLLAEYFRPYMDVFTFCPLEGITTNIEGVHSYKGTIPFENPRKRLRFLMETYGIIKSIHKEHHIDYILCPHFAYGFCAWLMKKIFGIPYGIMTHGNEVYEKWVEHETMYATFRWFILEYVKRQLLLNNATHIFTNTIFTKGLVEKLTKNRRISVINPPIGISFEKNVNIKDGRYILSLGRLVERKGYHLVIQALPSIIEKYSGIKYVIAGSGEYENKLRKLTKELGLDNSVVFKGRVSEDEKKDLMQNCSVFVLPSYEIPEQRTVEGFGLSLLEANMFGKFVISSKSGGIPEAVNDGTTGMLVKENNVESLKEALLKFFDKDFKYSPEECIEWAQRCHITNIVKQYFEKITEVV